MEKSTATFENSREIEELSFILSSDPELELAVLIGSRADGTARPESDWDLAIQWLGPPPYMRCMALTERLRHRLADRLGCSDDAIDLIYIPDARLAMRSVIAEEGISLKGADTLAWKHFLQRTWRELEEAYWEKIYAT